MVLLTLKGQETFWQRSQKYVDEGKRIENNIKRHFLSHLLIKRKLLIELIGNYYANIDSLRSK